MTYTSIPKGTINWDVPVNAAFTEQDGRITTNTTDIDAVELLTSTLEWQPSEQLFKSWTQSPESTQSVGTQPASGAMRLQRHKIRIATTITNLHVSVLTAGSGLTAGQNLLGLYNAAGNLLAQTDDQTTAWGSVGFKTGVLTSPFSAAAGDYYVGILSVGTTTPSMARGHDNSSSFINARTPSGQHRYITHGSGLTALPASVTLTNTGSTAYWTATS